MPALGKGMPKFERREQGQGKRQTDKGAAEISELIRLAR
jgi:hypothetical protein